MTTESPHGNSENTKELADVAQPVDLDDLPVEERVLLIRSITRVMNSPEIVRGRTSSTGKSIYVPQSINPERNDDGTLAEEEAEYRLDAETIFTGDSEFRDAVGFELYTPLSFRRKERSNYAPGPQAGANEIHSDADLPAATHLPAQDS